MDLIELIQRKKLGEELDREAVRELTLSYAGGEIPDYQMSALLMAWVLRGMTPGESAAMALAIRDSGKRLDWSAIDRPAVDKHSTGGVGDKVTLLLAPWLATCGVAVAKMSGRGLGFTGGTIDKLEALPGFRTGLSLDEVERQARETGVCVFESGEQVAPADHEIYALRDVTGTVDSPGLIAASIMGKKLAGGAGHIVIDLKMGAGAFMETEEDAEELAEYLLACGEAGGASAAVVMTRMESPLGYTVGNGLEVAEVLETVKKPEASPDLVEVCIALGTEVLAPALELSRDAAEELMLEKVEDGSVRDKLHEWITTQGEADTLDQFREQLERARAEKALCEVEVEEGGYLTGLDARRIGELSRDLGAGRKEKGREVDPWAGIELHKQVGDEISAGDKLATLYGGGLSADEAERRFRESVTRSAELVGHTRDLVLGRFGG